MWGTQASLLRRVTSSKEVVQKEALALVFPDLLQRAKSKPQLSGIHCRILSLMTLHKNSAGFVCSVGGGQVLVAFHVNSESRVAF